MDELVQGRELLGMGCSLGEHAVRDETRTQSITNDGGLGAATSYQHEALCDIRPDNMFTHLIRITTR